MNELKKYGFDPDKIEIKDEEYKLGALMPVVINETGQYDKFLPLYEPQADKYETWGCTIWGSQNMVEIYFKTLFKFEPNYNEIFNYVLAGVNENGGSPHNALESFRHDGLIDHKLIPFPDTFQEFKTTPITEMLKAKGKEWLAQYELKQEWIIKPTKEDIKNNLKFSPIGIGVTAWFEENGLYVDNGLPNTHWCVAYGYKETSQGIVLKIFDSYDHSIKLLHPNHNISVAKKILIKKKEPINPMVENWQKAGFYRKIWLLIKKFLLWK